MAERRKIAPWERYTDGEWHLVRTGPDDEDKADSLRIYRNHAVSAREWGRRRGYRAQISRRQNGRTLHVRLTRERPTASVSHLRDKSRSELGASLVQSLKLLEYALHLRMYGENAPGGNETWTEFDRRCELFLRKVHGLETS